MKPLNTSCAEQPITKTNEGNKPFNDFCCLFSPFVYCSAFVWECSFGRCECVFFFLLYSSCHKMPIAARTKEKKQATTKWKHIVKRQYYLFGYRSIIVNNCNLLKIQSALQWIFFLTWILIDISFIAMISKGKEINCWCFPSNEFSSEMSKFSQICSFIIGIFIKLFRIQILISEDCIVHSFFCTWIKHLNNPQ